MVTHIEAYATISQILAYDIPNVSFNADALYLHGLSQGMIDSCDLFSVYAWRAEHARWRIANGSDGRGMPPQDSPGAAWPGFAWYEERLQRLAGILQLIPAPLGLHTRSETDGLVEVIKEKAIKSVVMVTIPTHQTRSLSCLVASLDAACIECRAYYASPSRVKWDLPMAGSQGAQQTTLREEAAVEVGRVMRYWEKGAENDAWKTQWAVPPGRVLEYLKWRG